MIAYRKAKFEAKFINCNSLLYYFGLEWIMLIAVNAMILAVSIVKLVN